MGVTNYVELSWDLWHFPEQFPGNSQPLISFHCQVIWWFSGGQKLLVDCSLTVFKCLQCFCARQIGKGFDSPAEVQV